MNKFKFDISRQRRALSAKGETSPGRSRVGRDAVDSAPIEVLLIGRDPTMRIYTNEVLKNAGFAVRAITPWEAKCRVIDGGRTYPVVVFSHTLHPDDVSEIGMQLRRSSPTSKLLLILGSDFEPQSLSIFDATLEGMAGPAALVREVHRLAKNPYRNA